MNWLLLQQKQKNKFDLYSLIIKRYLLVFIGRAENIAFSYQNPWWSAIKFHIFACANAFSIKYFVFDVSRAFCFDLKPCSTVFWNCFSLLLLCFLPVVLLNNYTAKKIELSSIELRSIENYDANWRKRKLRNQRDL